ncbi:MAG: TatD family hydrolase [Gammaproteobacteria bacterium]|nr:TatD family hydrolase [Gammaproteobacteria bacterium]
MEIAQDKDSHQRLELIDSHCHLDFHVFDDTRESLINECLEKGIEKFIVPGVTAATWARLKKVSTDFPSIYPAYGLHPYFLNEHDLAHVDKLKLFLQKESAVAIGEIGLDYFLQDLDKEFQQVIFSAQLEVASELKLPVILHVRKAHDDVLIHLKKHNLIGGTVHAFNGSYQQAIRYIDLGFKLGFGGALTFDRAKHLTKLVAQLPLEAILLETDSPDMLPANYAEQYNTPLTILSVLQCICDIRNEDVAEVAEQITKNTCNLFSISISISISN